MAAALAVLLSGEVLGAAFFPVGGGNVTATLSRANMDKTFDGIGGLSGGGATSRLLVDYVEPQRSEILDYLFKPNFAASLQILKVEIGGDSQSTDGTEPSHMHSKDDLDYERGYEWWLMTEAKKRNPDIKLYGLPWAFPGWVGDDPVTGKPSGSPFTYPYQLANYTTNWVKGVKEKYGLDIDFLGVWNERDSNAGYVEALRKTLDSNGFTHTKIVAKDGKQEICDDLAKDPAYREAVDIIGMHYPSDYENYDTCHKLGKPFWASEESSSYDDLNGAACWARVTNSHYVLSGMTSSIMWNLVGAYYHGTNWYASSMLTSVEPWSGHYDTFPVTWATAHITQFTKIGWRYLKVGGGSGELPKGGFYTTIVEPNGTHFTLQVVKISHDHAPCTRPKLPDYTVAPERVTFALDKDMGSVGSLAVWKSNLEALSPMLFEKQPDVTVTGGTFSLDVAVGDFYTVSTVRTATKGGHGTPPASSPQFPLPHSDDFNAVANSQEAKYFADQIGVFEVHPDPQNATNKVMRQMVPELPIGWSDHGSNGPVSVIGMREWRDVTVSADFRVPSSGAAGCVGARSDQQWHNGVFLCVGTDGSWNLTYGGPLLDGGYSLPPAASGKVTAPVPPGKWHRLSLTVLQGTASGSLDGTQLFAKQAVRTLDSGFAVIGTNTWNSIEFDNFAVSAVGPDWTPAQPAGCKAAAEGTAVGARTCQPNGVAAADQVFDLMPSWELRHRPSGLCVTAASETAGAALSLAKCTGGTLQQFRNDYTRIRNANEPVTLGSLRLTGSLDGQVTAGRALEDATTWNTWSYFPNTRQLRNQYTANTNLGDPMCLSTCAAH